PDREVAALLDVAEQVEVAPPVAGLLVLEPVELLRGRAQRLDEDHQLVGEDARLAAAGAGEPAAHPDDVAEVEAAHHLPCLGTEPVELEPELEAAPLVLDVGEDDPAGGPQLH